MGVSKRDFDFSGYATRNDLRCSDGRTIRSGAFVDNDGGTVPLVWQHGHNSPDNVLGHALLENRNDGVYCYAKFNNGEQAKTAKELVKHGDVDSLSIFANKLTQRGGDVLHGNIVEVSLVLSGANPGARIDNVSLQHSDGSIEELDEAIIFTGLELSHADETEEDNSKEADVADEETVADVLNTLTDKQKDAVYYVIGQAIEDAQQDDTDDTDDTDKEEAMHSNIFEGDDTLKGTDDEIALAHSAVVDALEDARSHNLSSFKDAFLQHAGTYGIDNIEVLFPDARAVTDEPTLIKRRTDWVSGVLNDAKHSPFSRIKSIHADITDDKARALGYTKGNRKKEEVFKLLKRVTTPTTVYKKQKFDRDDLIDITDLNVVAWVKKEMRLMLDEEIARALLIGDGRDISSQDKINEENIRPIWKDDSLYAIKILLEKKVVGEDLVDAFIKSFEDYEGAGSPKLYTTQTIVTELLLLKDKIGRRLYETKASLAAALGVSEIVEVPVMKGAFRDTKKNGKADLIGIVVNLADYTIGADKGGEVNMFDDFDIDFNQFKYLLETRISGALTQPKTAIVIERKQDEGAIVAGED
ncbi:HK97 family phage prohead protease [uncultured Actinomyces sp.]|uniref:HK97 family phage prohead protease n=1 Tax=uncultured Actinomyces sp. TaxID=249061 RepID=UPI0028D79EAD|nr:phage major capsid protein [uncultured Actinomyces sp.]